MSPKNFSTFYVEHLFFLNIFALNLLAIMTDSFLTAENMSIMFGGEGKITTI